MSLPDDDLPGAGHVNPAFGVQVHHPWFLKCIGAPGSARLLGRSSAEWIQVIDRQDIIVAVLELQRDARLMASNLSVLNQYVTSLHCMSTEALHLMFGQELFPSCAVDEVAPVSWVHHASTRMAAMGLWHPPVVYTLPALYRPALGTSCSIWD